MNLVIDWELYLDVSTPEKATRMVQKLSNLTGIAFEIDTVERYNKGKITYKARLKSTENGATLADCVWAIVRKANRIARTWAITGADSEDTESGEVSFGEIIGTAMPKTMSVQGVESMEFRIVDSARSSEGNIARAMANS